MNQSQPERRNADLDYLPPYLTKLQVWAVFGIADRTLTRWLQQGRLRRYGVGRALIELNELVALLEKGRKGPGPGWRCSRCGSKSDVRLVSYRSDEGRVVTIVECGACGWLRLVPERSERHAKAKNYDCSGREPLHGLYEHHPEE